MNAVGATFLSLAVIAQLALPRRLAILPLLAAYACMPRGQSLELLDIRFTIVRVLVVVGIVRILMRQERLAGGWSRVDTFWVLWAACLATTSAFHAPEFLLFRFGLIWEYLGCYFLARIFLQDLEDVVRLFRLSCILVVPAAVGMLVEKMTGENPFAFLGGIPVVSDVRESGIRASGPFAHALLAGTVGASVVAMAICLWHRNKVVSLVGLTASLSIVYASGSSGPVMMMASVLLALLSWNFRFHLQAHRQTILIMGIAAVLLLDVIMRDPFYFVMARIDITGGSTGWHRAQLIKASIEQLHEWWLVGTDYTRHWMPTGIPANAIHTDITNFYISLGVSGGLPLMVLFILVIWATFRAIGKAIRRSDLREPEKFVAWTLGAILFGHVINFLGCSLFDQSMFSFLVIPAAAVTCWRCTTRQMRTESDNPPQLARFAAGSRPMKPRTFATPPRAGRLPTESR
jgi:hypothetical protein